MHMTRGTKKKYTLSLDADLVESARQATENLSETVCVLLRQFVAHHESERIRESLLEYESSSEERRKRLGMFGDSTRKFL